MIELKNGQLVNIYGLKDCIYYVENEMGVDFARECERILELKIIDAEDKRDAYKYELKSYEVSNEEYLQALQDVREAVEKLMSTTRITKVQSPMINDIYNAVKGY